MQPHSLETFFGQIWLSLDKFGRNFGKIWAKVIKIVANLIRFGQNQNLASLKTLDRLQL